MIVVKTQFKVSQLKDLRDRKGAISAEPNSTTSESHQPAVVRDKKNIRTTVNRKRQRINETAIPEVISIDDNDLKHKDKRESKIEYTTESFRKVMQQLESDDYFVVLGLERTATEADVKKAYRKLAIQWHPDKNRDHPKAEEYFKKIGEAYAVLSDREKRSKYELYGKDGHGGESSEYAHYYSDPFDFGGHAEFTARHARDIFEAFFGGLDEEMFGRRTGSRRRQSSGPFEEDPMMGFGGFGMPMMMGFGSRRQGGGGSMMMESLFSDFGAFGGGGMGGFSQSVSTSSYTDQNGQTVTRKTTTSVRPDGTRETTTEEFRNGRLVDQSTTSSNRLAGAGRLQLDSNVYETSQPQRKSSSSSTRRTTRRY